MSELSITLLIPVNLSGAIIGKEGANIAKMRATTCRVQMNKIDNMMNSERILEMTGNEKAMQTTLQMLFESIDHANDDTTYSIKVLLAGSQVGGVIGKAGSTVATLRSQTKCQIKVFNESDSQSLQYLPDRVVGLTGESECIKAAIEYIIPILAEHPAKPQSLNGMNMNRQQQMYNQQQYGNKRQYYGGDQDGTKRICRNFDKEITTRMALDANEVGVIIGKGGATITQLRRESGARVNVSQEEPRHLDMVGSISQVQNCLNMVSQIMEYAAMNQQQNQQQHQQQHHHQHQQQQQPQHPQQTSYQAQAQAAAAQMQAQMQAQMMQGHQY